MEKERCESCGCYTSFGKSETKRRYKQHPIFNTDFSKPTSQIIEETRNKLVSARGTLDDIKFGTGWEDRVDNIIGLLTCGIHCLYAVKKEMEEIEHKQNKAESN